MEKNRKIGNNCKPRKMAIADTMTAIAVALETIINNRDANIKLGACPVKRKNCALEAWLTEVELWDTANDVGNNGKHKKRK